MPDEDKTFSGSLVLDLRIWWRHVHTLSFWSFIFIRCTTRDVTCDVTFCDADARQGLFSLCNRARFNFLRLLRCVTLKWRPSKATEWVKREVIMSHSSRVISAQKSIPRSSMKDSPGVTACDQALRRDPAWKRLPIESFKEPEPKYGVLVTCFSSRGGFSSSVSSPVTAVPNGVCLGSFPRK